MPRALILAFALFVFCVPAASGDMVISEWMYNGGGDGGSGEFVEFTNTGPDPIDMTGWSYDDNSRVPGTVSLSAFGVVAPGQSVILAEEAAGDFATIWGLSGVIIIGGNTANLGRNDEINLYDAGNNLIDRLTYGDEDFPGTVRTQTKSCNIPPTDYGYTEVQTSWVLAAEYDAYGSKTSTRGEVASPGRIVGYARSDFDHDGDVDWADFGAFCWCMAGPFVSYDPLPSGCTLAPQGEGFIAADADEDGDVDLLDFRVFQLCFSGEGNPADPSCGSGGEEPGPTQIILNGTSITVIGSGVLVDGTKATITSDGVYYVSGTLDDGQLAVNTPDPGPVQMYLSGVDISNSTSACINVIGASHTEIILVDQTENVLFDATTYVYENPEDDEPNAALFSDDPLTISGTGELTVYGNYNDAIASKDELVITSGVISVIAVDDGIRGKDYLRIEGGAITVTAVGDGLKSDNEDDPELGYITIENGLIDVTSGGDAIAAETDVSVTGGDLTLLSGGGHTVSIPEDLSAKGIKGLTSVQIEAGTFDIDAADDGIHSNNAITISDGTCIVASGDDALHSDVTLGIDGGTITITDSFEGIESADIAITNGEIDVTSSDDAITADTTVSIAGGAFTLFSGGGHTVTIPSSASAKAIKAGVGITISGGTFDIDAADDGVHAYNVSISGGTFTIATNSSTSASYGDGVHADNLLHISGGTITVTTSFEGIESKDITIDDGTIRVTSTDDGVNAAGGTGSDNHLYINGGYIAVYAAGDGIDVNGWITMTGGTVIVHGPTQDMNAAIDYDRSFNISGGFLVAAGSAGMAQAPSTSSTQRSVKITYNQWKSAGTLAHIETTATPHADILTFAPSKTYRSIVFSAPTLTAGTSYDLYRGGSSTGTVLDGLYTGGTYSGGTKTNTFTTNNIVTNVNAP